MSEIPIEKDPPGDPMQEKDSTKAESQIATEEGVTKMESENELQDPEIAELTQSSETDKSVQPSSPSDEDEKLASADIQKELEQKELSANEDKQKKENPLEVVGSWFQGLVKNNPTSTETPKAQENLSLSVEAVQENIVQEEDSEKEGNIAQNLEDAGTLEGCNWR
jgi:hypothetical protein